MIRLLGAGLALVCLLGWLAGAGVAQGAEVTATGRGIVTKWQQAVVTIEVVTKTRMAMFGQEEATESKGEAIGTIIDPNGLVVSSLSSLQPMSLMETMMGSLEGIGDKLKSSSEITGVKILLTDGKELPAQIVLKDKDLDLVFLRPVKTPEAPLPTLSLAEAGSPEILEQVFTMTRLGTAADRATAVLLDHVNAVVTKPRKYYVIEKNEHFGAPVFTAEGKVAGILVLRILPGKPSGLMNMMMPNILSIVLPAAEIAEVAQQAVK